jgi:plasmid stabilization system protein ParE
VTRLRWTAAAAADLECIAYYLIEHTPENATNRAKDLRSAKRPKNFPKPGTPRAEGRDS